jgi:uncharacterized sulfatase
MKSNFLSLLTAIFACLTVAFDETLVSKAHSADHPNILWITSEDNGPELGCYGDSYADTPNIDAIAQKGVRFMNCWSNAPVCAPARTTLISGMWPTSLGAQHMRSEVTMPKNLQLYPEVLRQAGYFCTNQSKTDYNLAVDVNELWNQCGKKAHWRDRPDGTPFFSVFNFTVSHESKIRSRPHTPIHDPAGVSVPPFHPDLPEVRRDWAQYYDKVTEMDRQVGKLLRQLEKDGLADDTIVFYYGDHGTGMPRGKRWLYQTGLHVPLIVHVPEKFRDLVNFDFEKGGTNDELVGFIDLAPTVLSLAGANIPALYQGRAFMGPARTDPPETMFGFRDRMDEVYDCSRAVRTKDYLYIRNWKPHRAQGEFLDYMFQTPTTQVWKAAFDAGQLNAAQSYFWQPKLSEELYDLNSDPHQIHNLVADEDNSEILQRLRNALKNWTVETGDLGLIPEALVIELADGQAPWTLTQNKGLYPVETIYEAADVATRSPNTSTAELDTLLSSQNPVVRYWGATGYLVRCQREQIKPSDMLCRLATEDPTDVVRCVAAETAARFSDDPTIRSAAIDQLVSLIDQRNSNYLTAVEALNAIVNSNVQADEIDVDLTALPTFHTDLPGRYKPYVPDLLSRLQQLIR